MSSTAHVWCLYCRSRLLSSIAPRAVCVHSKRLPQSLHTRRIVFPLSGTLYGNFLFATLTEFCLILARQFPSRVERLEEFRRHNPPMMRRSGTSVLPH